MESTDKDEMTDSLTAVDYINKQAKLEQEARELMPLEPDECTYNMGEIRQPIFACLTCSKENGDAKLGICYSCSIQCHSTHDLVELFAKRLFVCDCGTTKMSKTPNGACKLRLREMSLLQSAPVLKTGRSDSIDSLAGKDLLFPAEDIPSLSNVYNQNFSGLFCSCKRIYNPLKENGNMLQCHLGVSCGEDWFHDECVMGFKPGTMDKYRANGQKLKQDISGENQLDNLLPPGEDAFEEQEEERCNPTDLNIPYFPFLDDFDVFICWKCVQEFDYIFKRLGSLDIVLAKVPHFTNTTTLVDWETKFKQLQSTQVQSGDPNFPLSKKAKVDRAQQIPYSYFLKYGFKDKITSLKESTTDDQLLEFFENYKFFYQDDPIYEPPTEAREGRNSTTGSLLELGADALHSLPRDQAIDGIQAYSMISSKLRDFLKPFAEQGKVVTEDEVRNFFDLMKKK